MAHNANNASFGNVSNPQLRKIIVESLSEMTKMLEETPCLGATSLADQLNDIKKDAFEQMYAIGHETMDRSESEEVLKAIRALQDAFGQIIVAISPMDSVRQCLQEVWLRELSDDGPQ
jgi:ferritin-like metal-binding protein YciE